MTRITSADNPKLRYVRRLAGRSFRAREGRWVLEGVRLISDALAAGTVPSFALVDPDALDRALAGGLVAHLASTNVPLFELAPGLLATVAETATPQGLLAVVPAPALAWPAEPGLVLVVDGLRDPGNLGTLLRGALAAGADAALLAPGTVDLSHPRVLRSAMGAHFRLPVASVSWPELTHRLAGLSVWLAAAGEGQAYDQVDWQVASAVVLGGEAQGLSAAARALGEGRVHIPLRGPAESLNAAMAGTVLLFEAARQREAAE